MISNKDKKAIRQERIKRYQEGKDKLSNKNHLNKQGELKDLIDIKLERSFDNRKKEIDKKILREGLYGPKGISFLLIVYIYLPLYVQGIIIDPI